MEITWTFAVLVALSFAVVKALESELEHWGLVVLPRIWLYARAIGAIVAFVLSQVYQTVPQNAMIVLGALAIGLGVLGYWPEVQKVGARVKQE